MTDRFSADSARAMPVTLLRAVLRERAHHLLEQPVLKAVQSGQAPKSRGAKTVECLLQVWEERGLPTEAEDLAWINHLLHWDESGLDLSDVRAVDVEQAEALRRAIEERRSVRQWDERPVPRGLLEQIVRAGQWAPCACNLQTLRVLIVDDPEEAALFKGEVGDAPAQLVVCQDTRAYEFYRTSVPERNRGLDCGAAMQNMLLMAHGLGLGAVWLTFSENRRRWVREQYGIPAYIDIVSYIALGWPAIQPPPPGRMDLEDVLLERGKTHAGATTQAPE